MSRVQHVITLLVTRCFAGTLVFLHVRYKQLLVSAALVSRQFVDMSRIRIEGLLAAFPKLVGSGKQHTYVETENVRYVYQPIEVCFLQYILVYDQNSQVEAYNQPPEVRTAGCLWLVPYPNTKMQTLAVYKVAYTLLTWVHFQLTAYPRTQH